MTGCKLEEFRIVIKFFLYDNAVRISPKPVALWIQAGPCKSINARRGPITCSASCRDILNMLVFDRADCSVSASWFEMTKNKNDLWSIWKSMSISSSGAPSSLFSWRNWSMGLSDSSHHGSPCSNVLSIYHTSKVERTWLSHHWNANL